MARGWESKSVEEQQFLSSLESEHKPPRTVEQIAQSQQCEGLRLSRERVLQQLRAAQNPHHRCMLEKALADLEVRLSLLGGPDLH